MRSIGADVPWWSLAGVTCLTKHEQDSLTHIYFCFALYAAQWNYADVPCENNTVPVPARRYTQSISFSVLAFTYEYF